MAQGQGASYHPAITVLGIGPLFFERGPNSRSENTTKHELNKWHQEESRCNACRVGRRLRPPIFRSGGRSGQEHQEHHTLSALPSVRLHFADVYTKSIIIFLCDLHLNTTLHKHFVKNNMLFSDTISITCIQLRMSLCTNAKTHFPYRNIHNEFLLIHFRRRPSTQLPRKAAVQVRSSYFQLLVAKQTAVQVCSSISSY